ncbi:heat shock protein, Hsp20 family [Salinisphaera sp. S4-8]|uniref:Hsp20/alpha crystallin family protein n=1 Tax=Salinisphaera sp. S4-8 TaxID=633357 RepID=UPI003341E701
MAIQRYQNRFEPSSLLAQFNDEINRMFVQDSNAFPALAGGAWTPNVDIRETDNAYHIEAEVPGVNPEDIEVTLDKGVLTLKGERSEEKTDDNGQARYRERRFGSFVRRFSLPETADEENIEARAEHGVLRLTINKKATSEPRRITVRSGDTGTATVDTQDQAKSA